MKTMVLASCLSSCVVGAAVAHHSSAGYDFAHILTVEGTVKTVNWTNPHITFLIDVEPKAGVEGGLWNLEASSPGVMTRSGWTKRSLQPGDRGTFDIAPLRSGGRGGVLTKVSLPNGQVLTFSGSLSEQ